MNKLASKAVYWVVKKMAVAKENQLLSTAITLCADIPIGCQKKSFPLKDGYSANCVVLDIGYTRNRDA